MKDDRLLTQEEIMAAPRPTATYILDHEEGVERLISVNMTGVLQAQDAKTASIIRAAIKGIENPFDDCDCGCGEADRQRGFNEAIQAVKEVVKDGQES